MNAAQAHGLAAPRCGEAAACARSSAALILPRIDLVRMGHWQEKRSPCDHALMTDRSAHSVNDSSLMLAEPRRGIKRHAALLTRRGATRPRAAWRNVSPSDCPLPGAWRATHLR